LHGWEKSILNTSSAANQKNEPRGGFAASGASHRILWHRVCASARMIAAAHACPKKNAVRNLGARFLESEGEMRERMKIARVAGRHRLGATPAGYRSQNKPTGGGFLSDSEICNQTK
jgi:hypothetical protein